MLPSSPAAVRGKRVLVMGLGTKGGGLEVVKWLVHQGAHVVVTDQESDVELQASLAELRDLPVTYILGQHRPDDFRSADLVVRNPAVPLESPFLKIAAESGIPVVMDSTLFFQFCPAPIAGVTGTRGKSTTVAVAGEILRRARPETVIAGNIGRSPLADLERIRPDTPVVLELSSWQLEGLEPFGMSPHWALLTCILPDHLNRYPSFEAYVAAKETIVTHQRADDVAILPADDPWGQKFAKKTAARVVWFGVAEQTDEYTTGLFRVGNSVLRRTPELDELFLPWEDLCGVGEHSKRNLLAGALLALEMGASPTDVREVLRTFRGLPNRLEIIGAVSGRTFVNDTAATIPEAVIAALNAFPTQRVVLIAGGTDKNLDFRSLAGALQSADNLRAIVFLEGSATEKIRSALGNIPLRNESPAVRTMSAAVEQAWTVSRPGDVILLSPGAASFELFRDEFDRGDQFRAAVHALG
ncbi:MAG: UDP-N-acetylmuramoylalanine--D-glutamate ligase [Parcubacteria group bacterium Gr01-1014_38]|nr:MAG: UDP-N-acetylmuramoylalanine--D-glutamate ligase [Parcubacteria group bacterium Gr01-1014_38]